MNDYLPYIVTAFAALLAGVLVTNLRRAKRYEAESKKIAEVQHASIALQERQVAAIERIANALERHSD